MSKQGEVVGGDTEERHVTQRELPGISAHKIPRQPECREQSNAKEHLHQIIVMQEKRSEGASHRSYKDTELPRRDRIVRCNGHCDFVSLSRTHPGIHIVAIIFGIAVPVPE